MKRSIQVSSILLVLSLFGLAGCGTRNTNNQRATSANATSNVLPEMTLRGIGGETLDTKDLKGKKVFVNLWATWCGPCVAEMPTIEALYQKTKSDNVAFLLISMDNSFDKAIAFARQKKLNVPVYEVIGNMPDLFNVPGIPATFVFDAEGKMTYNHIGMTDYSKQKFVEMMR